MKEHLVAAAVAASPTYGPAIITLFGVDVPVLSATLSISGLLLARLVGPPPTRKLTKTQNRVVTVILLILLFLIVTGELPPDSKPLGVGMAFGWGVGLGLSGLLALEFLGDRVMAALKGFWGLKGDEK